MDSWAVACDLNGATGSPIYPHIFALLKDAYSAKSADGEGQGVCAMADFRDEARGCLQLAQVGTDPEVKTVLMGMALGWLTLADHMESSATLQYEPEDDV